MRIAVKRGKHNDEATLGTLYLDRRVFCYTLEDQPQAVKVPNETRIPAGEYKIKLRNEGSMTKRYAKRYPFHEGMLHLQDVPGFEWIYIHTGNTDDHTSGCILVGDNRDNEKWTISGSRNAYSDLYRKVVDAARNGDLTIKIYDETKRS
ncbi:MAG: hypothetical protein KAJ10_11375 [Thermodesulfovibrionia bacterium]|nr:hypothetical protein [Thermodesulfovibrionia bacterium]